VANFPQNRVVGVVVFYTDDEICTFIYQCSGEQRQEDENRAKKTGGGDAK
jgi:hypothetical protein